MLIWKTWQGDAEAWDAQLMQLPDYHVYQSYNWGEHRSRFGWVPYRLVATEAGQTVSMAQVLVRKFPLGVALAWVTGGPVGFVGTWGDPFRAAIRHATGARHLYCRINAMCEQAAHDVERIESMGWSRPTAPILSGMSLAYSPSEKEDIRLSHASGNWRHNLRRSLKYGNEALIWSNPDPDEIMAVYQAMQSLKNLQEQVSRTALVSIFEAFCDRCIIVRCNDAKGRLLALRGALIFGSKAWDIFAAATPEARNVYASHAAFWELMIQCANRGVQWYDMSGVDPIANKGVYDFKKGTGATDLLYLGEWDWATSSVLRHAANYFIKRRVGGM